MTENIQYWVTLADDLAADAEEEKQHRGELVILGTKHWRCIRSYTTNMDPCTMGGEAVEEVDTFAYLADNPNRYRCQWGKQDSARFSGAKEHLDAGPAGGLASRFPSQRQTPSCATQVVRGTDIGYWLYLGLAGQKGTWTRCLLAAYASDEAKSSTEQ